jgi:hypothetical protein
MASQPTHGDRANVPAFRRAPKSPNTSVAATQPSQLGQRRGLVPRFLTGADIRTLQRTLGNLATLRLLSPVLQPERSVVANATPANSDVIQRKFSIQTSRGLVEFADGGAVDGYKEELRTAIRRKRRANDADDIYHYIKTLATAPDDLGSGTWEQLIQTADNELGTPYEDEPPTKKQRRKDMKVVEGRKRSYIDSGSIDMSPTVRLGSWNPEKYGKGTKSGKREGKKSHVLNVLDTYNPAFLGLMEISNASFLLEGSVRKPGIRNASLPFYNDKGIESLKRDRQFAKTKREGNLGYKPSDTYEMHEGPRFTSGGYGENYPGMYNTSQIIGEPTSFTVDLSDGQRTSFDLSQPQQPIPFSTGSWSSGSCASTHPLGRSVLSTKGRFPWSTCTWVSSTPHRRSTSRPRSAASWTLPRRSATPTTPRW